MRIGFDLDGTLDREPLGDLAGELLAAGHEVFIISGTFNDAGAEWQNDEAKRLKVERHGIPCDLMSDKDAEYWEGGNGKACLIVLEAVPKADFEYEYRIKDMGLRKGELCDRLGIQIFFDDNQTYVEMIPKMAGGVQVLHVR